MLVDKNSRNDNEQSSTEQNEQLSSNEPNALSEQNEQLSSSEENISLREIPGNQKAQFVSKDLFDVKIYLKKNLNLYKNLIIK